LWRPSLGQKKAIDSGSTLFAIADGFCFFSGGIDFLLRFLKQVFFGKDIRL